jgi:hypothetical protein
VEFVDLRVPDLSLVHIAWIEVNIGRGVSPPSSKPLTKAILNGGRDPAREKALRVHARERRARAEETILEQRLFAHDDDAYKQFIAILDAPAKPDKALRATMKRKPPWER